MKATRHIWFDITTDHKTNQYVGKDLIKVISFLFSLFLSLLQVAAMWISSRNLGITDLIGLFLFTALGSAGIKLADNFYRRKTADEQGNPMTVPTDEVNSKNVPPYPLANPQDEKATSPADPAESP